jgi:hypothetical protein
MKGYAPEIVYAPQTAANVSAAGVHLTRRAKAPAATATDATASSLIPTNAATG